MVASLSFLIIAAVQGPIYVASQFFGQQMTLTNNATGTITLQDSAFNNIAGFDLALGGWYGPGMSSSNASITNLTVNVISNYTDITITTNVTFEQSITVKGNATVTNITIQTPGGLTNKNVTASTIAAWDLNKNIWFVPNGTGFLFDNGSGTFSWVSAAGGDLGGTYPNPTVTSGAHLGAATVANSALANSSITLQGAAVSLGGTTLAAGSSPSFSAINFTNPPYIMQTNNGGGNALASGSPGAALTCILTNITANTTLAAMTFWTAGLSVIPVYASCSGGTDRTLKFPANFQGSGDLYGIDLNGTGVTITNSEASWFEVRCIYGVKTNVFRSNTK
jgi:hypothetical protein